MAAVRVAAPLPVNRHVEDLRRGFEDLVEGACNEMHALAERVMRLESERDELRRQLVTLFEIRQSTLTEAYARGPNKVVFIPRGGIALVDIERAALKEALRMADGIQKDAAALLRISQRVMTYKMQTLGIRSRIEEEIEERHGEAAAREHHPGGAAVRGEPADDLQLAEDRED